MTRYGVPDDDMPDSQPSQIWGSANERDLDALLSGEADDIPEALSAVAAALAALRATPASGELAGEDRARAAFRAEFPAPAPNTESQAGNVGRESTPGHTLILPSGGAAPRRAVRHRRARLRRGPGLRRPAVLLGSAALIVVAVLAVAFTGLIHLPVTLESFGGRPAAGGPAVASGATSPGARGTGGTETTGGASAMPTPHATPVASGVTWREVRVLCQEYYSPRAHRAPADHKALGQQLGQLAGSRRDIMAYCRVAFGLPPHGKISWPAGSGFPGDLGTGYVTGSSGPGDHLPHGWAVPQLPG